MTLSGFFDESAGTSSGEPFAVAGYIFKPTAYKQFCRKWKALLRRANVPVMHMVDLYHGQQYFKGMTVAERGRLFDLLVEAITDHMMAGVGASFSQREFAVLAPTDYAERFGGIYATACQVTTQMAGEWMDRHSKFDPIAYVFEDGHKHEYQAGQLLRALQTNDTMKQRCRYHSVKFMPKASAFGLQAADLMAWAWTRERAVKDDGKKVTPVFKDGLSRLAADDTRYLAHHLRGKGLKSLLDGSALDPATRRDSVFVGPGKRALR